MNLHIIKTPVQGLGEDYLKLAQGGREVAIVLLYFVHYVQMQFTRGVGMRVNPLEKGPLRPEDFPHLSLGNVYPRPI
ncbi:hypothetical protein Mterra_00245 [Calidithermus terrae]|uniref:Uncharacterized protein n=1 Tax=Calidithermus terrae TaxID=1408545 RepID=A0A399F3H0_9DEIN|nr:hypothetical protein [Calidithermus terrae]RIH90643.1 hypothetical protein Mterra_00245 [Calidithermus terrae]